ncbi:MAG: peptidoglycan DD-metalloendopeptidase family protein [Anaerolineae bacterium]|nr:peptidoglycan DD-metalloendopeptidase family protein [Anaerolineae bacterium]
MERSRRLGVGSAIGIGCLILLALRAPIPGTASQVVSQERSPPTPTTVPFLYPPFARQYRTTSYFDHHYPDRGWDDTLVLSNGDQASAIDGILDRTATFRGGYWLPYTFRYVYYDGHNAIDYGTGAGTTILAAAPGEVVFAGSVPSSCDSPLQYVCLKHADGYRTFYLHLEGICVRAGDWVETGEPLGISGNSGCSLGPHLHFAVEHQGKFTDPYGWYPTDTPDPLLDYSGVQATWLWAPGDLPLPMGKLTHPPKNASTNGDLYALFLPDEDSPPIERVEFLTFYQEQWHRIGVDEVREDGWSWAWDTRDVPEGETWLHAWAVGMDGRVSKASPIRTDITVDRHPPQGAIVGLLPGSTAGRFLSLYASAHDATSGVERVTYLARERGAGEWREIGDGEQLEKGDWLLEWDAAEVPGGAQIDLVARLVDRAGNETLTEPVEGISIDPGMPAGELSHPKSKAAFATTLDLVFVPSPETPPIDRLVFYAWYDGDWHQVGEGRGGEDGWRAFWDPASVGDQSGIRVQARVYDLAGRVHSALPQVTGLVLDRKPPSVGYIRPATGGVARPDVAQSVWAWDGGSGVDYVEFFVNEGEGWLKIGEDRYGVDGWSLLWQADEVPDGIVDFSARATDRAGNEGWAADVRNVALDRTPPRGQVSFPSPGMVLSGVVTLTLEVTDEVSGLDRAVFYARYDDEWHHLAADAEPDDGFGISWDAASVGEQRLGALTAWVYDRAGNYRELSPVMCRVGTVSDPLPATPSPAPTSSPTPSPEPPTASPTAVSPTATQPPVPSATPVAEPAALLEPTASPSATPPVAPASTPTLPVPRTASPASAPVDYPVRPAFWYLVGGGVGVALVLLILSLRNFRATSRR